MHIIYVFQTRRSRQLQNDWWIIAANSMNEIWMATDIPIDQITSNSITYHFSYALLGCEVEDVIINYPPEQQLTTIMHLE